MNEDDLRRVLELEASQVEVSPHALGTIRQRIADRRTRWLPKGRGLFALGTGGVVAVATVVAVFAGVGSCAPLLGQPQPPAATTEAAPRPSPPGPTTMSTPSAGPTTQVDELVYVYYVGLDRNTPRLYRESHTIPAGDGSVEARTKAALAEIVNDDRTAYDPDYFSAWPDGARVLGVRIDGAVVVVDLSGLSPTAPRYPGAAVQELIWTATANTGLDTVRVLVDGAPVDQLWGSDVSDVRRAPAADVQGLVWLISPQEGDTVGKTFEVHVYGAVFEATVAIRVRQGTTVVQETFVTVDAGGPEFGEGKISLTLAPGTYTLEAFQSSPADGSVMFLDDHRITVR
jgi:hypothetical protein